MTDGSANVALDGTGGREKAMEDALAVSNLFVGAGVSCLVIDVSRVANPKAKALSEKLGANYIPMPFVSSKNLSDAVKASR
jgi:magnesium chelatase subunit D